MTLAPLLAAGPVIIVHSVAALLALGLGVAQLLMPKGQLWHRVMGRLWVGLMAVVVASSFGIHELRWLGPFSAIHLVSIATAFALIAAVRDARAGRIASHRARMLWLFGAALIGADPFTLLPDRIMHQVLFAQ